MKFNTLNTSSQEMENDMGTENVFQRSGNLNHYRNDSATALSPTHNYYQPIWIVHKMFKPCRRGLVFVFHRQSHHLLNGTYFNYSYKSLHEAEKQKLNTRLTEIIRLDNREQVLRRLLTNGAEEDNKINKFGVLFEGSLRDYYEGLLEDYFEEKTQPILL